MISLISRKKILTVLQLWGEEVDPSGVLTFFSQRSVEKLNEVDIYPGYGDDAV